MSSGPDDDRLVMPPALARVLAAWRRRLAMQGLAVRLGWTMAGAAVFLIAAMACDLRGDPWPWLRIGLCAAAEATLVAGVAVCLLRHRWRPDRHLDARRLESAAGLVGEPLSGAVALVPRTPPGTSRWMASRALALAAVAATALDLRRLAPLRRVLPSTLAAGGALLAMAGMVAANPVGTAAFARAVLPWRDLPAPGAQPLVAEPGDLWLAPGGTLEMRTTAGPVPIEAELAGEDGSEIQPLRRDGGRHSLLIGPLYRDLRWRLRGPGLISPWHRARIAPAPVISGLALHVHPPAWTGLPSGTVAGGDAELAPGSEVGVEIRCTGPTVLAAAIITPEGEVPLRLEEVDGRAQVGTAVLRPTQDLPWRLRLIVPAGDGGVAVEPPQRWLLRVRADQPPVVTAAVDRPAAAPGRAVRIDVTASDDLGLAALWLEVAAGRGEPMRIALPAGAGQRRTLAAALVVPRDVGAGPGDRLILVPGARDRAGAEVRGTAVEVAVVAERHADAAALAADLGRLLAQAESCAVDAAEVERGWRAAARTWRPEDPVAGAGDRHCAGLAGSALATAATALGEAAGTLAAGEFAPANLEAIATRAAMLATSATVLVTRAAPAEAVVDAEGDAALAGSVARSAAGIATSTALASASATLLVVRADGETAAAELAGAAAVLIAERTWQRRGPGAGPTAEGLRAMAALSAGAGPAAVARARAAAEAMRIAVEAALETVERAPLSQRHVDNRTWHAKPLAAAAAQLRQGVAWDDPEAVAQAAQTAAGAQQHLEGLMHLLREVCRSEVRGEDGGGLIARMRRAAAHPALPQSRELLADLQRERESLAGIATAGDAQPAYRAAALAAAWAIDAVLEGLEARDEPAARAATAAAAAPLALLARHRQAVQARSGLAMAEGERAALVRDLAGAEQPPGGSPVAVLSALAEHPGWSGDLLRPARDRLRSVADRLRQPGIRVTPRRIVVEAGWAVELESRHPGRRPIPEGAAEALAVALDDLSPEALLAAADALDDDADIEAVRPDQDALQRAADRRLREAGETLAATCEALVATVPALQTAARPDLAARLNGLEAAVRALRSIPDAGKARALSAALAQNVAAPIAAGLADGSIPAGGDLARSGRLAAQAAADAARLAVVIQGMPGPDAGDRREDEPAGRVSAAVPAVHGAAADAELFPEDERPAIHAYLRRVAEER